MCNDERIRSLFGFWDEMTPLQQECMREKIRVESYETGARVALRKKPETVWALAKGRLGIMMYSEDGRQIRLMGVHAGEFGVVCGAPGKNPLDYYIEVFAEEETELCVLSGPNENIIPPEALRKCERAWHQRLMVSLTNLVGRLSFSTLEERLVCQLREYSMRQHRPIITITHEKLAEELGTSREVVSRLLMQLSKEGMVELKRKQIRLC